MDADLGVGVVERSQVRRDAGEDRLAGRQDVGQLLREFGLELLGLGLGPVAITGQAAVNVEVGRSLGDRRDRPKIPDGPDVGMARQLDQERGRVGRRLVDRPLVVDVAEERPGAWFRIASSSEARARIWSGTSPASP